MNLVIGRNTGTCTRRCYEKLTQYNHHLLRLSVQPLRKNDVLRVVCWGVCVEGRGRGWHVIKRNSQNTPSGKTNLYERRFSL